ncbi:MAG: hypothetical protein KAU12_01915, partial [Candidatus Omnitrophica bacterium]|nr:hypothetical protein [Candidatus Omnitrophota bacterium]
MKKFFTAILFLTALFFILNAGPVWLQRLIGFSGYSNKVYFPQWINNEEYCYLRVESFFDYGMGFSGISKDFFHPLKFFRGSNATFSIYKVNINQPDKEKLIRKITRKVNFTILPEEKKLYKRERFAFRRLDNGELVLLIRGRLKYIAYYMETDGRVVKRRTINYNRLGEELIVDISLDSKKLLMSKRGRLYIKDINTQQEYLFSESQLYYNDCAKWINNNNFAIYRIFDFYAEREAEQDKYEVYITDEEKENIQLLYHMPYRNFEKVRALLLDAVLSSDNKLLFLSNIGLFKKQAEK